MYCVKNILEQYKCNDKDVFYCDGPFGCGIHENCFKDCENTCKTKDELVIKIGNMIIERVELM